MNNPSFSIKRQGWSKCAFISVTKTACEIRMETQGYFFCPVVIIIRSHSGPLVPSDPSKPAQCGSLLGLYNMNLVKSPNPEALALEPTQGFVRPSSVGCLIDFWLAREKHFLSILLSDWGKFPVCLCPAGLSLPNSLFSQTWPAFFCNTGTNISGLKA